ncbi:MAG: 16S rRNA (cytosine(1402)-N(4))-methyltransferase RsmH [Pseudomonadota bacterium]
MVEGRQNRRQGQGANVATGGPHIPVMLDPVLTAMAAGEGDVIVDATFGAGGYSRALLDQGAQLYAVDRDPDALVGAAPLQAKYPEQLVLLSGRFSQVEHLLSAHDIERVDAIVADIGVSSMQIDQADRGFSFLRNGPLDMRMAQTGPSAADVVNHVARPDLTRIIGILGEERQASRVAAEIAARREKAPFETTEQLAACVESVIGRRGGDKIHPATRTFQALRIYVNRELEELAELLLASERLLVPNGRLVIVTFHSLEDRLVKKFFQDRSEQTSGSRHLPPQQTVDPTFVCPKRTAIKAERHEIADNSRARSAKLRFGLRTQAAPRAGDLSLFGLPNLPALDALKGMGA